MKRNIKRLLTLVIAAALVFSCVTPALALSSMSNFTLGNKYSPNMFSDVNEYAWYGDSGEQVIRNCYNLGFIEGMGEGKFGPDADLTIAQAVTMAARIRSIYEGGTGVFPASDPWYKVYFDYAKTMDIIPESFFAGEENEPAWRCEMAYIIAHTLPEKELGKLHSVSSLPDVSWRTSFAQEIYTLYEAGILVGNDKYGTFAPESTITRAAAAAIVSRLVLPAKRQNVTLTPVPPDWLDDYSNGELLEYFLKLAYGGDSARNYLVRFTGPIYYYVGGTPNYMDMNLINDMVTRLNSIEGFPGMQPVGSSTWANLQFYFVKAEKFKDYSSAPKGSMGYTEISPDTATGAIKKSVICIASELSSRAEKDSVISEGLLSALGLNSSSWDFPDSIFYAGDTKVSKPDELDWALVELLYSPKLTSGSAEALRNPLWGIIEEKALARQQAELNPTPTPTASPKP